MKRLAQIGTIIRNFLTEKGHKELLVFLFFFFMAAVFWLTQTLNEDYTTHFRVPLRLKNLPAEAVVTMEPPAMLDIEVRDKGTVLVDYIFNRHIDPVIIDFSKYDKGTNQIRLLPDQLKQLVKLLSSSSIVSVDPDTVMIIYARGEAKRLPIVLNGLNTAGKPFSVSQVRTVPDSVEVYAPAKLLADISEARTEPIELRDMSDTLRRSVALTPVAGAKFVPNEVDIHFELDIFSEKRMEIPIVAVGVPHNVSLKTFPSKVTATFQVGLSRFRQITPEQFSAEVSYDAALRCGAEMVAVRVTKQPDGVSNLRITPTEVDFLIETSENYGD